jgi:hypothetical protein
VDDGIHAAYGVDLARYAPCFSGAAKITDGYSGGHRSEFADGRCAIPRSGVKHNPMTLAEKCLGRGPAEAMGAAGDEHERH